MDTNSRDARRDRKTEERRARLREKAAARAAAETVKEAPAAEAPDSSSIPARPPRKRKKRRIRLTEKHLRLFTAALILILAINAVIRISDYVSSDTDVKLTDKGITHADRFSGCVALNGIDVSEHQGKDIKWKKVKSSGVDFVFIRAGYRDAENGKLITDECFKRNVKKASRAGIMTGAYFYSQALTPDEAREEAEYLMGLVKSYDITMPLVIDYEIYPNGRVDKKIQAGELYAASLYHDIVLAFCRRVESEGYESAVYANRDMLTNYMDVSLLQDNASVWLAEYGKSTDLDADYWFWQCSDKSKVGGIDGKVDHDFWYMAPGKVYKTRAAGSEKKSAVSIADAHISFQRRVTKIRGRRAIPKLSLSYEGRPLAEGTDYVISFVRNTEPGTGYIIVRGAGRFKGWIMQPFNIK